MSVGGKVIEIVDDAPKRRIWINTSDHGDECAIFVARDRLSKQVVVDDIVWWQGRKAYWTTKDRETRVDVPLLRIGFSGVLRPRGESEG